MDDHLPAVMRLARPLVAVVLAGSLFGACSGGADISAALSAPASASASAEPSAPASAASGSAELTPSASASDTGSAVGGTPGAGITPVPIAPVGPGQSPGGLPGPSPTEVSRVAGLLGVHDVRATAVEADVSNGHLIAKVFWWSGPSPCSELAAVSVELAVRTFTLTVEEGAEHVGVACPALAMYKVTSVDLGPVVPGTYRVNALGVDPGPVLRDTG
jgi:hypothetical protein